MRIGRSLRAVCATLVVACTAVAAGAQPRTGLAFGRVPAGSVRPLFDAPEDGGQTAVAAFLLATRPVSNAEFLQFVRANPSWQRSRVPAIAADAQYLRHWQGDRSLGSADPDAPVVNVSWFAASAYAEWVGARLPLAIEWDRAVALGRVRDPGTGTGALWAWVDDFNGAITSGESRADAGPDEALFCAAGVLRASNTTDYGAFMRYAMRGALKGRYALATLGVWLVRDAAPSSRP